MQKEKLISYIQLINTTGVGPVSFRKYMEIYGSVDEILEVISRKKVLFSRKKAEEELMTCELKKVEIITLEDELYPYNLKQIEDCPPILYAKGHTEFLKNDNALAVIGSRNASLSALKLAEKLSYDISKEDILIVSGMASGVDASAHVGALNSKQHTIAVLGTGIDVVYPKENEGLYNQLCKDGLVLSEYPFHTKPQASNFPRRNRIVSGLSKSVLVIEAGLNSGSLITAGQALEQGRDVYAVPGAPYDAKSLGCNKLLKDGAILVDEANDVINSFYFSPKTFVPQKQPENLTADLFDNYLDNSKKNLDISNQIENTPEILSLISKTGEDIDELIRKLDLSTQEVIVMLMELELEGRVIRLPGNRVARA